VIVAEVKQSELRILLAEDHSETRQQLQLLFELEGWQVTAVEDGVACLHEWWAAVDAAHPFAVVVLDLAMPRMDGLSVAVRIRENEHRAEHSANGAEAMGLPAPVAMGSAFLVGYTAHTEAVVARQEFERVLDVLFLKPGGTVEWRQLLQTLKTRLTAPQPCITQSTAQPRD
jgi:CheY-like chemotaxis protein